MPHDQTIVFSVVLFFPGVGSSHYHSEIHQHNELIHVIILYIYTCRSKSGRYMCTYRDIMIVVYCILNLEILTIVIFGMTNLYYGYPLYKIIHMLQIAC